MNCIRWFERCTSNSNRCAESNILKWPCHLSPREPSQVSSFFPWWAFGILCCYLKQKHFQEISRIDAWRIWIQSSYYWSSFRVSPLRILKEVLYLHCQASHLGVSCMHHWSFPASHIRCALLNKSWQTIYIQTSLNQL